MTRMIKLEPCPFCGNNVSFAYDITGIPHGVVCIRCHMVVKFSRIRPPGKHEKFERVMKDIAEAWNRRER